MINIRSSSSVVFRFARLGATVVTWDINKVDKMKYFKMLSQRVFLKVGNEETVAMIKKEGNKAFSYIVDMSSRCGGHHFILRHKYLKRLHLRQCQEDRI